MMGRLIGMRIGYIILLLYYLFTLSESVTCSNLSGECDWNIGNRNDVAFISESLSGRARNILIDYYSLNDTRYKMINVPGNSSVTVYITNISLNYSDFLVVHAHSQIFPFLLRFNNTEYFKEEESYGVNPALVIVPSKNAYYDPIVVIENNYSSVRSVVLLVRNYTYVEPIPGGFLPRNSSDSFPLPSLSLHQNLLTTSVTFPLASFISENLDPLSWSSDLIKYSVYLSYLYEGNLKEDHYLEAIVHTSTITGLKKYATDVINIHTANSTPPELLFVSYSGVGAVLNVVASVNGSAGVLYSTAIFYGCDFAPGEEFNCTKLVSTFAKLVCACFPFIGFILLFFGHRWLNFTMFISGLLASWFLLFSTFVQIHNVQIQALGICTLVAAVFCGVAWLAAWHWFKRPFFSALLLILLSSLFTAMISTHFLKYALVPSRHNIAAFIVFPIIFVLIIVGYSIFDIKKTHIFSCCILGSYLLMIPFAFYFHSSLIYIVFNVVSLIAVPKFAETIGFPPFQFCDIILLCVWIASFLLGMGYQFYRERSCPPFYPPNTSSLNVFIRSYDVILHKVKSLFFDEFGSRRSFSCCCNERSYQSSFSSYHQITPEEGRPWWRLRAQTFRTYFTNVNHYFRPRQDYQEHLHEGTEE